MKKQIALLIMTILIVAPVIQDVTATQTVFITSDNIVDHETDIEILNSLKNYIEEYSDGELQVIVDNQAPGPGEGWRAIEVTSDVSIELAAADAGNYLDLAKSTLNSDKQVIIVNTGDFDLNNNSIFLRRAWDDNYSNESLAGIQNPGGFLEKAGIYFVQPSDKFQNDFQNGHLAKYDEEMTKEVAKEIVDIIKKHGNDEKVLSDGLVKQNVISPSVMAKASKELIKSNDKEMEGQYGNYTAAQLLYQTSSYLNGDGLDVPKDYDAPDNPMGISFLTKDSYSIYDYFKMGGIVKEYMDQNGKAPDSIQYEGAYIGYYDLVYNFAKITQNHTTSKNMGFDSEYHFDRVNDSILLHILPFVSIIAVLIFAYYLMKRFRIF